MTNFDFLNKKFSLRRLRMLSLKLKETSYKSYRNARFLYNGKLKAFK